MVFDRESAMKTICLITCTTVFSLAGGWLGRPYGLTAAWLAGFAGSLIGVYIGCRIKRDYMN